MLHNLLVEAVPTIADALAVHAVEKCRDRVIERDDLQPVAVKVLRQIAMPHEVQVGTAAPLRFPEDWPRLGPVDIALRKHDQAAFVELKCGSDKDAFGPCVWDALKCAFALRKGAARATYLLAATSSALWRLPIRGAELFEGKREWAATQLRADFVDWWRKWEREGSMPLRVPAWLTVEFVAASSFQLGIEEWQVRLARVSADDGEWYDWQRASAI